MYLQFSFLVLQRFYFYWFCMLCEIFHKYLKTLQFNGAHFSVHVYLKWIPPPQIPHMYISKIEPYLCSPDFKKFPNKKENKKNVVAFVGVSWQPNCLATPLSTHSHTVHISRNPNSRSSAVEQLKSLKQAWKSSISDFKSRPVNSF